MFKIFKNKIRVIYESNSSYAQSGVTGTFTFIMCFYLIYYWLNLILEKGKDTTLRIRILEVNAQ